MLRDFAADSGWCDDGPPRLQRRRYPDANRMDLAKPPDRYWHCLVEVAGSKGTSVVNDMDFEQVMKSVVEPWHAGRPFTISGTIVRSPNSVEKIKIVHTPEPGQTYANRHDAEMRSSGIADLATDRRLLPFSAGEDLTFQLLFEAPPDRSRPTMLGSREPSGPDQVVSSPSVGRAAPSTATNPREVAVVHGRDSAVASAVFEFLRALDLRPLEWEELLGRVSAATPYTGSLIDALFENVQAIVVVFTPDDEARLHPDLRRAQEPDYETRFTCQARPNVLFEAGMAFGLYPQRTILVEVGDLRPTSDLVGRHTVRLAEDKAISSFVNRLRAAGCALKTDGADWLRPSRFSSLPALSRRPAARLEILDQPPRLIATNIWLNPWTVDIRDEIVAAARAEHQVHPVMARSLQRDLSRSVEHWSLYSKKEGPNAPLRLKGQVNLQASGPSDLRLLLVQQRFAVEGRPVANPPDAGPFGFAMMPGQEINANFEIAVPDRRFDEGELLYGLHVVYEDESKARRELEIFWWYDFSEDKFWNNLNKVPYFDSIRANFW